MSRILFALPLLALASAASADPPEFENAPERFIDARECQGHLQQIVDTARGGDFDVVEGPYALSPSDVRAHMIRADGLGHRVSEYRCEDAQLSARTWIERMDHRADGAFSIESLASAQWLEQ